MMRYEKLRPPARAVHATRTPTAPLSVAVDAINAEFDKYERRHLEMMLRKAYVGFVAARSDPDVGGHTVVATGHWGCGAFCNDEKVMFTIQALVT